MLRELQPHSQARTKELFDEEHQFIAPGLQTIALLSELAIERGNGATLTDCDGNTYLDLNAGVSVASLGHAHPRYVAALSRQLEAVSVGSFTSQPRVELVRLIADLMPGDLTRTQFFSGGEEDRHRRLHGRFSWENSRRPPALGCGLEELDRAAADRSSPRSLCGPDKIRRLGDRLPRARDQGTPAGTRAGRRRTSRCNCHRTDSRNGGQHRATFGIPP